MRRASHRCAFATRFQRGNELRYDRGEARRRAPSRLTIKLVVPVVHTTPHTTAHTLGQQAQYVCASLARTAQRQPTGGKDSCTTPYKRISKRRTRLIGHPAMPTTLHARRNPTIQTLHKKSNNKKNLTSPRSSPVRDNRTPSQDQGRGSPKRDTRTPQPPRELNAPVFITNERQRRPNHEHESVLLTQALNIAERLA